MLAALRRAGSITGARIGRHGAHALSLLLAAGAARRRRRSSWSPFTGQSGTRELVNFVLIARSQFHDRQHTPLGYMLTSVVSAPQ